MSDTIAHPIDVAWISSGETGAQNYDEFASETEVEAAIARHPNSVLGVEMPQCTPEAVAAELGFAEALPKAAEQLRRLQSEGHFSRTGDVVAPYRITSEAGTTYGVLLMVDTDQISSAADEPGLVIRNEDVNAETVGERVALIRSLHHLLSPVLLVQATDAADLEDLLAELVTSLGDPAVHDTDQHGQEHDLWLLSAGEQRDRLLQLVGAGELIVADGNHRTLAAQQAGLPRFLALVTTPGSAHIRPYNRLVERLGMSADEFLQRLTAAGADVEPWEGEVTVPVLPGTVAVYLEHGRAYAVTLPAVTGGSVVDRLDHSVVERVILGDILDLRPHDRIIKYVGGDYPAEWLTAEVDAGRAEAAILISPVSVEDFLSVNLERLKMPRKSTWFTPKARAGLVLAELTG
ncbi:MAG: DUF1015 family protein [Mycobacteriales bacterium]